MDPADSASCAFSNSGALLGQQLIRALFDNTLTLTHQVTKMSRLLSAGALLTVSNCSLAVSDEVRITNREIFHHEQDK